MIDSFYLNSKKGGAQFMTSFKDELRDEDIGVRLLIEE
jgi:hypothetical protein